ncbi:MAG: M48 family metalloprotease [Elusimicrobia bacterium]|nr:M48 family metalloprotease [Elusimicrobiota bacterium]
MKKFTASLIASVLVLLAPGIPAYAAGASVVRAVPAVNNAINGSAGAVRLSAPSFSGTPASWTGSALPLQSALPGITVAAPFQATPDSTRFNPAPSLAVPVGAPAAVPNVLSEAAPVTPAAIPAQLQQAAPGQEAEGKQGAPGINELLSEKETLQLSAGQAASMKEGDARATGEKIMDRILGRRSAGTVELLAAPQDIEDASLVSVTLSKVSDTQAVQASKTEVPSPVQPQGFAKKAVGLVTTILRMAGSAGAVLGLQHLAVTFLPAVFGLLPAAAVWAVGSGILLLPAALYARYRLSLRDSPRLTKVKWMMDLSIGALIGAAVLAAPGFAAFAAFSGAQLAMAALPLMGLSAGRTLAAMPLADNLMTWGALALLPAVLGLAAAGTLGLGPILGMLALPVMTTVSFFLGRIIFSAESGRPFSVPGNALQKMRFPAFIWVMTGVVFALLTGYGAVYSNWAFVAWNFLGSREPAKWDSHKPLWSNLLSFVLNFNTLYFGLLAFNIATGFASPLMFLTLAFSVERASHWAERLLVKFLPRAQPAPSTLAAPAADPDVQPAAAKPWPKYYYRIKTGLLIAAMAGGAIAMAATVFGFLALGKFLLIAGAITAAQVLASTWLIKKVMKAQPAHEATDPEFFALVRELRDRINAERAAKGKKAIPMPEMVITPMGVPNAFATGRSPFKAMVGITPEIKDMLLNPDSLRESLPALIKASDPAGKPYQVFRKAIAKYLPGVQADATPEQLLAAVAQAEDADLAKLGYQGLRGVLAHEMSHVMDRHMVVGAVSGAIASGVAFASYSVMWAVGHAKVVVTRLWDKLLGKKPDSRQYIAPLAAGPALASLVGLIQVFAALWVPTILQILQMGSSRSNEGMADEDGAKLSAEPESLAIALGLLTTWRPKPSFFFDSIRLPLVMAVSHLMTVNPVEQLHRADALKLDDATQWAVGKKDDFLFNLFITHPDTNQRISRLLEMAQALTPSGTGVIDPELEKTLQPGRSYDVFVRLKDGASVTETDQFVYYVSQAARNWERSPAGFVLRGISGRDIKVIAGFSGVRSIASARTASFTADRQPSRAEVAAKLMEMDREVFAAMMGAAIKGVLATALAAAAFFIHPVLTVGVGLVALAQYYRMIKFMILHNKLQKAIQDALL